MFTVYNLTFNEIQTCKCSLRLFGSLSSSTLPLRESSISIVATSVEIDILMYYKCSLLHLIIQTITYPYFEILKHLNLLSLWTIFCVNIHASFSMLSKLIFLIQFHWQILTCLGNIYIQLHLILSIAFERTNIFEQLLPCILVIMWLSTVLITISVWLMISHFIPL